MDAGAQIQQAIFERALIYAAMIWIVVAIFVGLWASEVKKRGFWMWFMLSLIGGPIAWYVLVFKKDVYIPPKLRMDCPRCGKLMSREQKRCPHCRAWVDTESKDRAANIGRQAATMIFTARRLMGGARRAVDAARTQPPNAPRPGTRPRPAPDDPAGPA